MKNEDKIFLDILGELIFSIFIERTSSDYIVH